MTVEPAPWRDIANARESHRRGGTSPPLQFESGNALPVAGDRHLWWVMLSGVFRFFGVIGQLLSEGNGEKSNKRPMILFQRIKYR